MSEIVRPEIERYAEEHSGREPEHLTRLAEETRRVAAAPQMMVGRLEGRFVEMLVALTGARRVLEIGTFTGYSSLSMAEALPAGGTIVTCEIDPRHAEIARRHIAASDYGRMIEVRLGPALDTLAALDGPFDFAFIDADKTSYGAYYDAVLPLLSEGGVIAVDNVLWSGAVLDPTDDDPDTRALVAFNERVSEDPGVDCVMVPIRDGVTLIRRL